MLTPSEDVDGEVQAAMTELPPGTVGGPSAKASIHIQGTSILPLRILRRRVGQRRGWRGRDAGHLWPASGALQSKPLPQRALGIDADSRLATMICAPMSAPVARNQPVRVCSGEEEYLDRVAVATRGS